MKLLKFGVGLVVSMLAIMVALASLSYVEEVSSDITMEEGIRTFTEENCVEDEEGITCVENSFLQADRNSAPEFTGYVIKEKIFVPKYVEKEKIIEKKLTGEERESPVDRIKDDDVNTFSNSVRIDIKNAKWRRYVDSNSMDPLIDIGTTTIEIKPRTAQEIRVGDIVAYDVEGYDYAFVHRVIEIGNDEEGSYFVTKGDNYWQEDPGRLRFKDIEGIVVGILY